MPRSRIRYLIPIFLGALLLAGFFLLVNTTKTSAQCGSQASSCKNCHETQSQDPVNNDGTAWHSQHAQIDACVSCHAGNPQSTDQTQAHTGMVAWDSDIKAGCASCHPDDYTTLAQEYATTLGVSIGAAGNQPLPQLPQQLHPSQLRRWRPCLVEVEGELSSANPVASITSNSTSKPCWENIRSTGGM